MNEEIKKHPLNVQGRYYVAQDCCTCMGTCELAAPNNFAIDETHYTSYVFKQPETPEEEEQCQEAIMTCAFEAIFDDGE